MDGNDKVINKSFNQVSVSEKVDFKYDKDKISYLNVTPLVPTI